MTDKSSEHFSMLDPRSQAEKDRRFANDMETYFACSLDTNMDKLRNFTKFVPRQALSIFLGKHAIFQRVVGIHGYVIECGVFLGGG